MRIASLLVLAILVPSFAHAAVVINEIAWMGTSVSANAEWIELFNNGSNTVDVTGWSIVALNGSPSVTLTGSISANGYFLLERTSDSSVPAVSANQIYTGALTNSGTTLTLSNSSGSTVDQVEGGANWANIGGDNASKNTAQRTNSGWETAPPTPGAINAGVTVASPDPASTATSTASATTTSSNSGPPEYMPIPALRIITGGDRTVSSGADTAFTAVVYDGKWNRRDDATVSWSFGDGMKRIGANVYHAYYYSGDYVVVVHAITSDGGDALSKSIVTVKDASIKISSISARGISLTNNSSRVLDLSFWRLSMGGKEFKIPSDTQILSGKTILFPSQVIDLTAAETASLLYPSGEVAATYPTTVKDPVDIQSAQPISQQASFNVMQTVEPLAVNKVEPVISTREDIQTYDKAVIAPTVATELAAVGAASATPASKLNGMFKSPWTLGLLGVMALAGVAFVLL